MSASGTVCDRTTVRFGVEDTPIEWRRDHGLLSESMCDRSEFLQLSEWKRKALCNPRKIGLTQGFRYLKRGFSELCQRHHVTCRVFFLDLAAACHMQRFAKKSGSYVGCRCPESQDRSD